MFKKLSKFCVFTAAAGVLFAGMPGCGSSGGGGGSSSDTVIEGTLRFASAAGRVLTEGEGGIAGVEVSSLGSSAVTDDLGNFTLRVDGEAFGGGSAQFTFIGEGIEETVILEELLGGPGVMAFANFILEDSGAITGESTDAEGNVLGTTPGGRLNCSVLQSFVDGPFGGSLWKPHSERTGTVVVLMPPQYAAAQVEVLNNRNEVVDGPLIRDCCSHNGGREHVYLTRTAADLAGAGAPLTVRFSFPDGFTDCRVVPDPNQRYD